MKWQQGAGFNIAVCGYSMQHSLLIQFCHIAYLKIFGRVQHDYYLNNVIGFNNNV